MNEQDFEQLLDDVLREDVQVEPLAGLDDRILQRVSLARKPILQRSAFLWGLGLLAACLLIALSIPTLRFPSKQTKLREVGTATTHASGVEVSQAPVRRNPVSDAVVRRAPVLEQQIRKTGAPEHESSALPEQEVFPSPSTASEPMRELAKLSNQKGNITGLTDAGLRERVPTPLAIAPIKIAAIEIAPLVPLSQ